MDKKLEIILGLILIAYNLIVFIIYGIDKKKAIKHRWRIPEKVLILLAICFGGFGAFLGMRCFRHKTKHAKFMIIVPVCLIVQMVIIVYTGVKFM